MDSSLCPFFLLAYLREGVSTGEALKGPPDLQHEGACFDYNYSREEAQAVEAAGSMIHRTGRRLCLKRGAHYSCFSTFGILLESPQMHVSTWRTLGSRRLVPDPVPWLPKTYSLSQIVGYLELSIQCNARTIRSHSSCQRMGMMALGFSLLYHFLIHQQIFERRATHSQFHLT